MTTKTIFEWDKAKNERNIQLRGLSFEYGQLMDLKSALVIVDNRKDYSETRYLALGKIFGRLHAMVFVYRNDKIRIISLRKANTREVNQYETEKNA